MSSKILLRQDISEILEIGTRRPNVDGGGGGGMGIGYSFPSCNLAKEVENLN